MELLSYIMGYNKGLEDGGGASGGGKTVLHYKGTREEIEQLPTIQMGENLFMTLVFSETPTEKELSTAYIFASRASGEYLGFKVDLWDITEIDGIIIVGNVENGDANIMVVPLDVFEDGELILQSGIYVPLTYLSGNELMFVYDKEGESEMAKPTIINISGIINGLSEDELIYVELTEEENSQVKTALEKKIPAYVRVCVVTESFQGYITELFSFVEDAVNGIDAFCAITNVGVILIGDVFGSGTLVAMYRPANL